jgi:predicted NAD-dependent protein-ADP-ribosyltransferase YbiA (DUF1768 family)
MTDKLFYYSKSKDVLAGKGSNEHVSNADEYSTLNSIKDWRKILSNFYCEPFEFEGKSYNSIEHAFQGYKIGLANKELADRFTIDSGHEIGLGDGAMAQKNRKLVKLSKEKLEEWDKMKFDVMTKITTQRLLQSEKYRNTLFATNNAELWHVQIRKKPVRNKYLEDLRSFYKDNY